VRNQGLAGRITPGIPSEFAAQAPLPIRLITSPRWRHRGDVSGRTRSCGALRVRPPADRGGTRGAVELV